MRIPSFSGLTPGAGSNRTAMFGALAFGVLGLAAAAGTFIAMSPSPSLGAAEAAPQAAAAPTPAQMANYKFAKDLVTAGVKGCAPLVEALSVNLMNGVTETNTISRWNSDAPNGGLISAVTSQKFGATPAVPNGLAGVFASPHADGKCDAMSVQVVPSPANCATLEATLAKTNKPMGTAAGIPVLGTPVGQVLLVPTGTNSCIIVGVTVAAAK